jgi:hypothetical protein
MTTIVTVLSNTHVSAETAYVVDDYPYGFRLRCQMRYWLEYQPKKGFRMWMQSSNPKRPGTRNKPKAGTYYRFGAALYLDENGHVHAAGLSEYSDVAECAAFVAQFIDGVPAEGQAVTKAWLAAKQTYEARQTKPVDHAAAAAAAIIFGKKCNE